MDSTLRDLGAGSDTVVIEDRHRAWSRKELWEAVQTVGGGLARDHGIAPGDRVVVVGHNSVKTVIVCLGARMTGALVCPVEPNRLAAVMPLAKPKLVVANRAEVSCPTVAPDSLLSSTHKLDAPVPHEHSWGITTSGTMGRTKVVMLTESSVAHVTEAIDQVGGYRPEDRVLSTLPIHHTYGMSQIWLCLRSGASLILPQPPLLPGELKDWLGRATVYPTVAGTMRRLVDLQVPAPELRLVTLASQATLEPDRRRFAAALPQAAFLNYHGLTEATTRVLWLDPNEFLSHPTATGRPIPGVKAWLDEEGQLWVDGPNVAAGYLDDPELTAERFPDGKLASGDLFTMDGDRFCYLGRRDGVFKRWGEKVVPELVESVVREHPEVEECLVTGQASENSDPEVVLWVVPPAAEPSRNQIVGLCRRKLPSALVPTRVEFVESLAKTASGKVIRRPGLAAPGC